MCFSLDAEPPVPPVSGGSVRGQQLVLTSMDGTRFAAYAGHVDDVSPGKAGIVIMPDVRGLYRFYRDLALRFASVGVEAVAIDYFGRTAGLTERDDEFDFWPHVQQTTPEGVSQDVASAIAYLRRLPGGAKQPIFTVGFCFGGGYSFLQAAENQGLAGVIGFYGAPRSRSPERPSPLDRVDRFSCPVLGLFGGADQGIPADTIQEFDEALARAHVEHEVVIYPDTPHSFFDRHQTQYSEQSADSWRRVMAFIDKHAGQSSK